mgnify:CR=1 FL=1
MLIDLEQRYANFNGMNLTWEMLEGIAKHNGPQIGPNCKKENTNIILLDYDQKYQFQLADFASAEAQISSISDDIAYVSHDLDDGLRANLFNIEDLKCLSLIGDIIKEKIKTYPNIAVSKILHESIRKLISIMIEDVFTQFTSNVKDNKINSVEEIRKLGKPLVSFSPNIELVNLELKQFLHKRVYRYYKVNRIWSKTKRIVHELFDFFMDHTNCLPTDWSTKVDSCNDLRMKAIVICDFIAGMTDRFAIKEHRRIFDTSYEMNVF